MEDDRAVVVLSHDAARQAPGERGTCNRLLAWLADRLGHDDIVIGVGCLADSAEGIHRSFEEARDAAEIFRRTSRGRSVVDIRWLGPHRLLLDLTDDELRRIAHGALGPVLEPRHRTLRETLTAFLDAGGDVASVAARLDLHRSSVYARVQRLETLLEADLSDGRIRLALQHALIALRLAEERS
jgi:DNA-binding PucR family transcriptional regulator